MADGGDRLTVRVVDDLAAISAAAWDACAGSDNPFVSHAFLQALEESGSATRETGWLPQHLILEDQSVKMLGAIPMANTSSTTAGPRLTTAPAGGITRSCSPPSPSPPRPARACSSIPRRRP